MICINGMAHVILTVSQFDKARAFYSAILPEFRMWALFTSRSRMASATVELADISCECFTST